VLSAALGRVDRSLRIARPAAVRGLLVAMLLLSFALRVYRLGDKGIWFDEGWSTWMAQKSLLGIAERTAYDTHPPLYFWALHLWRQGSGDSEFGLRYLSVIIGVLAVAATYLLGRTVSGRKTGLLASFLTSLSGFNISWSQEVRMYALAALLASLSLWAAIRLWDRGRVRDWVLYVLFTAAGLYTLYLFGLVVVVANLIWLWVWLRSKNRLAALVRWASAQVVVLLLLAPWLAYALGRIPTWSEAAPVALGMFLQIYGTVLATGISVDVDRYRWLVLPALAIFLAGLAALFWTERHHARPARNAALLLLGLLLPAGMVYLLSLPGQAFVYSPPLAPRYLLIFAPSFYILLAWGLYKLGAGRRWLLGVPLTVMIVGVALVGLWRYYPERILLDDYKSLAATLQAYRRPGDAVVLYTDRDWPVFAYHVPGAWEGIPNGQAMTPERAGHYLSTLWANHDAVWLVVTPDAGINDPLGDVPAWLEARATRTVEYLFADKALRLYARTPQRASQAGQLAPGLAPSHPLQLDVAPGLELAGYDQPVTEVQSGDVSHLFLYWKQDGTDIDAGPAPGVGLVSGDGHAWKCVQAAWPGSNGGAGYVRQQVDLAIPPDTPAGGYDLAVGLWPDCQLVPFGRMQIRARQAAILTAENVAVSVPQETDFAGGIRLLGYGLAASTVSPGDVVDLTLYWQAQQPVEHRYKVFTHLLGEAWNGETGNLLWGQQDNEPVNGSRPTSTWSPGEIILDSYSIALDPRAPAGRYTVEIGLYNPATGERVPVVDRDGIVVADHIDLAYVTVHSE
jgi:mannosyltransferase